MREEIWFTAMLVSALSVVELKRRSLKRSLVGLETRGFFFSCELLLTTDVLSISPSSQISFPCWLPGML